ncbi:HAE1 family hydrophobic/amphiphilic exporter-1 [Rhizomicrobium palustre]|uniref:HAE1 family hydrophobic/amphiphilic exporter-1 n=1 Tax=Rhizomicrobium palustre TaxID=189966 RepID=A0A846N026_9PROT|nr:efflux RND transporter permease subunit [Rhizomicrobium palustre]NIK88537.1 HAE1 family hydrophobic/amphiphilic exporter-1 [Rhizomicrobium palustre]
MNISRPFILRPVMTTLVMAAMVIFGIFGYSTLPVSELPSVDYPTIQVSASLPGADPQTMASSVATPIEAQLSQIAGIDSMTSSSSLGSTQITIQFKLDRNIDAASQDVQQAISAVMRKMPTQMKTPPTLRKVNPADAPILFLAMSSSTLPISKVSEYAETILTRQISVLDGVAQVSVFGSARYAVRIQANPAAMASRQIGINQLADAVNNTNVNLATGSINGNTRSAVIDVDGQLMNAAAFKQQIVAYRGGAPVRLGDVATVSDSLENIRNASWFNGKRAITLAVFRQPGANTIQVVDEIKKIVPQFLEQLPASVELNVVFDRSSSIRASVEDVQWTLVIAAILVVAVIFVFLRTFSATIIPSLALPIAVIGTFAGMSFLGYSLDNLSLMALTLSVGFVVDDAIVMLENIVRHVEKGETAFDAALKGAEEIGFTILSMTVSLAAVFIPVLFMGGIVGRLLHEFAVTIVLAIVISGIVSVTLTPMLCSRFLKDQHTSEAKPNRFLTWSENAFQRLQTGYETSLAWAISRSKLIFVVFLGTLVATVVLFMVSQSDFIPSSDIGMIQASTEAANGTGYPQMVKYQEKLSSVIWADPNIAGAMSSVDGNNTGRMVMRLIPRGERKSADDLIQDFRKKTGNIPGLNVFYRNPPSINIGGMRTNSQYQYSLQDLDMNELQDVTQKLTAALRQEPGFQDVDNDLRLTTPTVQVTIDRDRAASLSVTPQAIETALGAAYGGQQISQIYGTSDQYQVIMELEPRYQADATTFSQLYVTSTTGMLVPLTAVTKISSTTTPLSVNHVGQLPSATISFNLAPGTALSNAVSSIARVKEQMNIPASIQTSFQGTAKAFQSSMSNINVLLFIAIIVVYIVLGILYESFIHPLTILSGLPSAAVGALLTLLLFGVPLSLYAFVGMIMLIGIVKKNAIMMIDFALARQRGEGVDPAKAIYEAAVVRFRPIMMTTMAALMGTLPIAIGLGAGSEARRPLGLAVVGGLMVSQLLTLYITPVIYIYMDRLGAWIGGGKPAPQPAE